MDHSAHDRSFGFGWRTWLTFLGFAAIAAYFLFSEHQVHALEILPWALILLACPLMHMFMHGGHRGHGGHADEPGDGGASEKDRDSAPPATDSGAFHRH